MKSLKYASDYLNHRWPHWRQAVGSTLFLFIVLYGLWRVGVFDPRVYAYMVMHDGG